ncbi:Reverse transcriptase domain [Cinara cedri]|uniref:Reverse transcriptase domain n=1 Tax=Cinara cedri TaxID=506608 RepID=A0A5E4N1C9_9HEMI|nr:Reverse transcriptase domain [Cinara cedri]
MAIILLTHIYNAIIRTEYVPVQWKKAQVIMLLKPGKPSERVTSYRFISLLSSLSKLFEKLLLIRLKPLIEEKKLIPDHQFGFRNKHSTIDQLEYHKVLGPILYLIYTADIPTNTDSTTVMFADDTAILTTSKDQRAATDNLQISINNIYNWTRHWKIKINSDKSVHLNYTLRKTVNISVLLDHTIIPQKDSAKYLGMHLDSRLNWKHHVRQKKLQIKEKMRKLYWLFGRNSTLDLTNKRLLYVSIIKPI